MIGRILGCAMLAVGGTLAGLILAPHTLFNLSYIFVVVSGAVALLWFTSK